MSWHISRTLSFFNRGPCQSSSWDAILYCGVVAPVQHGQILISSPKFANTFISTGVILYCILSTLMVMLYQLVFNKETSVHRNHISSYLLSTSKLTWIYHWLHIWWVNTSRMRQNGFQFLDIFKCIFVNKIYKFKISVKLVPQGQLSILQHWLR